MGGWRRKWLTEQPVSQTGTDPTELHVEVLFHGNFMTKLLGEQSTILILTLIGKARVLRRTLRELD